MNPDFFNKARQGSTHEQSIVSNSSLTKKFQQARREGHLNLSSVKPSLVEVPRQVFHLDEALEEGEKFWEIEPLRSLDISFNAITSIPTAVGNLTTCHTIKARSNKLTGPLPAELFTECVALRILDLSQNELSPTIPEEIGRLQDLRDLSLGTNKLIRVPQSLFYLPNLRVLDLSHNQLQELPPGLSCTTLVSLNVAHNRLSMIPSLAALTALESVNCSSNQLQFLPDLSTLVQLKSLDASQNQLTDFPLLPRRQSKLNQLVLSYNRLTDVDMTTLELQGQLSEFLIHNNSLTVLPAEIEALQALKVLDVSNNDLQDLPATLGYITPLQILKLEGNRIKTIRQTLLQKNCQEIKAYLRTRGPSLIHPHETEEDGLAPSAASSAAASYRSTSATGIARQQPTPSSPPVNTAGSGSLAAASAAAAAAHARTKLVNGLTFRLRDINGGVLDLSKLQLQDANLDDVLDILSPYPSVHTVKTLQLQHNVFQRLPFPILAAIQSLFTDLKTLKLANNQLSHAFQRSAMATLIDYGELETYPWPEIVGIDVGYNKLSAAMVDRLLAISNDDEWRFPNLTELVLEHNPLGEVPRFLVAGCSNSLMRGGGAAALRRLQLNGCHLRMLSDGEIDFRVYVNLTHLDVSENHLTALPVSIAEASQLQFLSLENNDFKEIPSVLGVLPALQTLLIQGNPQRHIRTQIIQQGSVKIIQYLREKHAPGVVAAPISAPSSRHAAAAPASHGGLSVARDGGERFDYGVGKRAARDASTDALDRGARPGSAASTTSRASGIPVRPGPSSGRYQTQPPQAEAVDDRRHRSMQADREPSPFTAPDEEYRYSQPPPTYASSSSSRIPAPVGNDARFSAARATPPPQAVVARSLPGGHAPQPGGANPTSLAQSLRIRQECTPSSAMGSAAAAPSSSSGGLISARVKLRAPPQQQQPTSRQQGYGGGRSDPSAYW